MGCEGCNLTWMSGCGVKLYAWDDSQTAQVRAEQPVEKVAGKIGLYSGKTTSGVLLLLVSSH